MASDSTIIYAARARTSTLERSQQTLPERPLVGNEPRHSNAAIEVTAPMADGEWRCPSASVLYKVNKRLMDLTIAGALLIALSPMFLLIACLIKFYDWGPVFFAQQRVGRNGKTFAFYKFRTMVPNADRLKHLLEDQNRFRGDVTFKLQNDPRVTPFGRLLRKTSLDELPQLWNVLCGQMSIVGPRPPVPREVARYSPLEKRRLAVTPGLTCLWQVSGRSDLPFERQVELDLYYISHRSLWMDIVLIVRTIPAICLMRGAY